MNKNLKTFQVRWSDLDANRHVANTSYSHFTNDTRVSYLASLGLTQDVMATQNFGPVVFSEEFYYLRELHHGETIHVNVELLGNTADNKIWRFSHCFFNAEGVMVAYSELTFGWFNLSTRKLFVPAGELLGLLHAMPKSENYAVIAETEIRNKKIPKQKLAL